MRARLARVETTRLWTTTTGASVMMALRAAPGPVASLRWERTQTAALLRRLVLRRHLRAAASPIALCARRRRPNKSSSRLPRARWHRSSTLRSKKAPLMEEPAHPSAAMPPTRFGRKPSRKRLLHTTAVRAKRLTCQMLWRPLAGTRPRSRPRLRSRAICSHCPCRASKSRAAPWIAHLRASAVTSSRLGRPG